eukprot:Protomagalhaensia_wolfi_Nauph_80__6186@NODE_915_length_1889_cov_76_992432_g689_i0_p2_GENE_NODE_915_length_1889_cov_76_992432_g689_i0NODE_915_length_1889_cov_76_992432_g689_i0_p2_ORF_typecomplete_len167_score22_17_NODE_915_length_1889_cov_76_992432_g689_i029529
MIEGDYNTCQGFAASTASFLFDFPGSPTHWNNEYPNILRWVRETDFQADCEYEVYDSTTCEASNNDQLLGVFHSPGSRIDIPIDQFIQPSQLGATVRLKPVSAEPLCHVLPGSTKYVDLAYHLSVQGLKSEVDSTTSSAAFCIRLPPAVILAGLFFSLALFSLFTF